MLLCFLTEDGFKNNPKRLKIKHVQFFDGFFRVDETVKSIQILCSKYLDLN